MACGGLMISRERDCWESKGYGKSKHTKKSCALPPQSGEDPSRGEHFKVKSRELSASCEFLSLYFVAT